MKLVLPLLIFRPLYRRSPRGERGLKFVKDFPARQEYLSLPPRGARIEIYV